MLAVSVSLMGASPVTRRPLPAKDLQLWMEKVPGLLRLSSKSKVRPIPLAPLPCKADPGDATPGGLYLPQRPWPALACGRLAASMP